MKGFHLVIAVFWLVGSFNAMGQETNAPSRAKGLLEKVVANASQRPGWDEPSMAVENPNTLKKMPEFVELQQVVGTAWPQITGNIQSVAPTELSKTILLVAMQSVPPDNYLQFLDKAVGLAETKEIDKRLLKWALFPTNKNVRGVLDYNYDKPITQRILKRVKALYAGDPDMIKYCDAALSGEAKKSEDAYYNANPSEPRPGPAVSKSEATTPNPEATKPGSTKSAQGIPTASEPANRPQQPAASAFAKAPYSSLLLFGAMVIAALVAVGLLVWKGRRK